LPLFALINWSQPKLKSSNLTSGTVVDGTYIQDHELVVNSTGIASNITIMTGTNRDESGVLIVPTAYPSNETSFTEYFKDNVGLNIDLPANYSLQVPLEPFSVTNNSSPERILNASISITTDGTFTCFDLAKAYSGAKNNAFKAAYVFQFNRTYSASGYTTAWCNAPKTADRPLGDPDGEYYKCHGAEKLVMFGNAVRSGQPDRDGLDVPFMQLVVDYWSAFGRTGDPNPDPDYLAARGYYSSLAQVQSTGKWDPVDAANPTLRLLQWNGAQVPFVQTEQCKALGIPLDTLEV
jgi:carboxylesterase type B